MVRCATDRPLRMRLMRFRFHSCRDRAGPPGRGTSGLSAQEASTGRLRVERHVMLAGFGALSPSGGACIFARPWEKRSGLYVFSVPRPFRLSASGRNKFHPSIHGACILVFLPKSVQAGAGSATLFASAPARLDSPLTQCKMCKVKVCTGNETNSLPSHKYLPTN
jgi:hypothetical protein